MKTRTKIVRAGDPPNLELEIKKAREELERKGADVLNIEPYADGQFAYITYRIADK